MMMMIIIIIIVIIITNHPFSKFDLSVDNAFTNGLLHTSLLNTSLY